jgi:hypothetical protein
MQQFAGGFAPLLLLNLSPWTMRTSPRSSPAMKAASSRRPRTQASTKKSPVKPQLEVSPAP